MAFDYVNAKYPLPWDEDTEKLVAFLFGIISHQVRRRPPCARWRTSPGTASVASRMVSWKCSVTFQTVQPLTGKVSFHGSFGTAHDYGDVADDMIGVFEWNVTRS